MMDRRTFFRETASAVTLAGASAAASKLSWLDDALAGLPTVQGGGPSAASTNAIAQDEMFWGRVRRGFVLEAGFVNLNHGYSPSPQEVLDTLDRESRRISRAPLLHGHWPEEGPEPGREAVRERVAQLLGCDAEEVALTRSATEALQVVQLGIALRPGDEVLSTNEVYWAMWNTWQQRVQREQIVYSEVRLSAPHPPASQVIERIAEAITPKTKALLISHVTWLTGHVLPVAEICRAARERGVISIVDGAHGPGQLAVDVRALGCDFYGASGHKWLMGPLGTGFLYARRELIKDIWPLTPAWGRTDDIRKFEWVGGQSTAPVHALSSALAFHERLGTARKSARLQFLRRRWADRLGTQPRIRLLTSEDDGRACGLGAFAIDGIESPALVRHLRERHHILVRSFGAAEWDGPAGIRVAPNVFNSAAEIDQLSRAVETAMRSGLQT